jgi:hypothetical protein
VAALRLQVVSHVDRVSLGLTGGEGGAREALA